MPPSLPEQLRDEVDGRGLSYLRGHLTACPHSTGSPRPPGPGSPARSSADPGPGRGVGRDQQRRARARRRTHRLRQDAGRLPVVARPAGRPRRRPRTSSAAAGCSTSRRSRRWPSTSSATCAPRWPASARPPPGSGWRRPRSPSGSAPATPRPTSAGRFARTPAGHPDHHPRVAVPDAHQRRRARRCAASRRSSSTRSTRSPAPSAAPTSRSPSSGSTSCSTDPAQRIGLSATVRPIEEVAALPRAAAARSRSSRRRRTKEWDLEVVVPVEDMSRARPADRRARGLGGRRPAAASIWPRVEERVVDLIAGAPLARSSSPTPGGSPSG